MSLECYDNYIGIRSNNDEPVSGLYIEDLPGVDVDRMAEIAADENGAALVEKTIKLAADETLEEALGDTRMSMKQVGKLYSQTAFKTTILNPTSGLKGIDFELRRPDKYPFSKMRLRSLFVKAAQAVAGATIQITDDSGSTDTDPFDLEANVVKELVLDRVIEGRKFSAKIDHTGTQFYLGYLDHGAGCRSCNGGGRAVGNSHFYVNGGHGITAEVELVCDVERVKCKVLPYLKYAVLYKAGMLLAVEGKHSDRLNFYTRNMDFDEFYGYCLARYQEKLGRVAPNLLGLLKPQDGNCFSCETFNRTKIIY